MPTSDPGKIKPFLPALNEQATTGKEKAVAPATLPLTHPATRNARNQKRRRTNSPEEIDSDYAEEAEDFFYGEGM
jgi:hypothetical protein